MTGATGTMGSEAMRCILEHPDRLELTVLARDSKKNHKMLDSLESSGALKVIWGDLTNESDIVRGVSEADYVLHVGGMVSPAADHYPEQTMKVNVGAARLIARAVKNRPDGGKGVKVVYIGSVAQLGHRDAPHHWGRAGDPVWGSRYDVYAKSKIEAEREFVEAGIPYWVSLRQTGILASDIIAKGSDPITFHVPLKGVLEWVSAEDSGQLLCNICLSDNIPESFWKHFYNIGGGAGYRLTNYEFEKLIMRSMYCPAPEKVFDTKWFATRNFHGMWYEDSDILEDLFHFRSDFDAEEYFMRFRRRLPWFFRMTRIVPAGLIKGVMGFLARRAPLGTMSWVRSGNRERMKVYFGGMEQWRNIPDWEEMDLERPSETPVRLSHGYDESVDESALGIKEARDAAAFRGGRCLSETMTPGDLDTPLEWECHDGHRFKATPRLILLGGHWCPECIGPDADYDELARHNPFFAQVCNPVADSE